MHTSAPHRARIIAAPTQHDEPAPDMPAAQLSRQAALFQRLREGARAHASETDGDEQPCSAPAEPQPASPADAAYPIAGLAADEDRDNAGGGERDDDAPAGAGNEHDEPDAHAGSAMSVSAQIHPFMHFSTHLAVRSSMHPPMDVPTRPTTPTSPSLSTSTSMRGATPPSLPMPPKGPVPTSALTVPTVPRAQAASETPSRQVGGPRVVAAIAAPARAGQDMNRFVDSIVAEVSDFCANPIVLESGDWQLTIPIDPALLPGCTLNLVLSHFQLTLRFDTTDERSRELISQHATTLRESLEEVMQSRFDGTRGVEIIVT